MAHASKKLQATLVALLAQVDFADRYYAYCDARKTKAPPTPVPLETLARILVETGLAFGRMPGERTLLHEARHDNVLMRLSASLEGILDMGLEVRIGQARCGGSFALLAEEVALLTDPDFQHEPPYPGLPFSDLGELREALDFALGLFNEVCAVVVQREWPA